MGRADELAALHAALDAARFGRAPVIVVHGEAGIGKTRTVAEFARGAHESGATILWGSCREGGTTHPYGPWVDAIRGCVEELDPNRLKRLVGADAAVLGDLVPEIADAVPRPRDAAVLPSDQARLRLYEAVVRFLDSVANPVAVVLDDVQWADPAALDLFSYVARFSRRPLLITTYRGSELDVDDPLAQRVAEVNRQRTCEYLLLGSLGRADAVALLQGVVGRRLDTQLVEAIYSESAGNPFFLGELARHLSQNGTLIGTGPDDWRVPETIRGAIGLRLSGLSPQTRHMLEMAAVFTGGFRFSELLAITDIEEEDLLDSLDDALAAELIRSAGGERYDFAHALVRHTLYERFSPSRRARLHRRLADALERTDAKSRTEVAAELARQYRASATLPGAERGASHAIAAAEQARAAHAPAEAAAFLELALELAAADDLATRTRATSALALAQAEASMLDRAPSTLHAALSLLEQIGAPPESVATVVSQVVAALQDALADQDALEPLIARGLAALGETRGLVWARLKLLERPLHAVEAGPVHAARWLGFDPDAVRIARAEGSEADYARTIDAYQPLPLEELDALARRAHTWSDPAARLRGLDVVVRCLTLVQGVTPSAERLCTEFETLAEEVGSLPAMALARVYRAAILGVRGELEAAVCTIAEARGLAERFSPAGRVNALALFTGEQTSEHVDPEWSRLGELAVHLAVSREQIGWFGLVWAAFASHAFAAAGRDAEAAGLLRHIVPGLRAAEPTDYAQNRAVSMAAAAVWDLGAPDLAAELLPCAQRLIDAGVGDWYMTSNELSAARLATVLGHCDEALAHFASARQKCAGRRQRPLGAVVDFDEAVARMRLRKPGAPRLLSAACEQFAEMGMDEWSRRAALCDMPERELPEGLTPREAEILRLVAHGRTNKEIASELVVSVHTVERHLQNAYRKLSLRNRADAAAYVLRHDL